MSWHFWEIENNARAVLLGLTRKIDWYNALGTLKLGKTSDKECSLLKEDPSPLWIEATRNQPAPLCYLFRGELRAEGGPDPDVGFIGAPTVKALSEVLRQSDAFFLNLIQMTESAQVHNWVCKDELLLFPPLRAFFEHAADSGKAAIVMRD